MSESRRTAYPALQPHASGKLRVSDVHEIYWEECGNPAGKPAILVHGGPGGGSSEYMRRLHDPASYRIVLFDQRGCGRSTPHACIEENTTWDLVADMERIRINRGIERWQVVGGSWGSTLGLAYAESHPDRVTEIILRGIFTLRRDELRWFYQYGCSEMFPDAWERFVTPIPQDERHDMMKAYHRRLTSSDRAVQVEAARAWSTWEGTTISLLPNPARVARFGEDRYAIAFARIECHYFMNGGFFDRDDQLLAEIGRIRHIPGVIIQGRYDVVTPMRTAWDLHRVWPEADFQLVDDAGHAVTEPGITHEIVEATDRFRDL